MTIPLVSAVALLACVVGLGAATYIRIRKSKKKKLICTLRADCDKVVHSTHATTVGIPNEVLGIGYYIALGALHLLAALHPFASWVPMAQYAIIFLTIGGVLFSLYLVALQAFVIRAWCSWCLLSTLANVVLGVVLFSLPLEGALLLIGAHRTLWIIVHSLGFVLGVGGATITDVFFFKFMKDHQISEDEKNILDTISSIIWTGLAVAVVSGLMLFLPEQARLSESPKFLLKVVVVGVVIVNGIALNLLVAPRMRQLSFEGTKPARHFRRLAFALGGISIVSWYLAFFLGSIRSLGVYSLAHGVLAYMVVLLGVVIGSQVFERMVVAKYHALPENPPN